MLQKHFELMLLTMLYGCANGKEAKHFCFRDTDSASSRYVAWVLKQGNIWETLKVSVSQVIPRLLSHATYVEDTKSSSWKQKMLLKFPKNIFSSWTHFCFHNNVSFFAPALRKTQKKGAPKAKALASFWKTEAK